MSAKNRSGASKAHDRYLTPPRLARAAFERLYELYGKELYGATRFLEPGAGPGTFCRIAKNYGTKLKDVVGVELHNAEGRAESGYQLVKADFLRWQPKDKTLFDLSVSNPPFTFAEEFIRHNFALTAPNGYLLYLARIGLAATKTRRDLWDTIPLKEIWLCRPRPSFVSEGGSDASEYAFFLMHKCHPQNRYDVVFRWLDW